MNSADRKIRFPVEKTYSVEYVKDRGLIRENPRGSLANLAAKGYLLISTVRERSDGRDYSRDSQAAGRPALWPPARWRHGWAHRSSRPRRFRAPNTEPRAREWCGAPCELTGAPIVTRGGLEEGRPREEAEKALGEIQFSRKTKLGHGLVGLDAKGVSRG